MGKTYNKAQMESILKIYFSQEKEEILTKNTLDMVSGFLDFCQIKDIICNSDTESLVKKLYGANSDDPEKDDEVYMSSATRFRFKKSVFELFEKYLSTIAAR